MSRTLTESIFKFGVGGMILVIAAYIPYIRFEDFTLHVLGPDGYRALMFFLAIIAFSFMLVPFIYVVKDLGGGS